MTVHYSRLPFKINNHLQKTKKLFISTGCSFTMGSSAWPLDFLSDYSPKYTMFRYSFDHLTHEQKINAAKKFKYVEYNNLIFNTTNLEIDSSYTSQLQRKYLPNYTIANLGLEAKGILSSVLSLYMTPINYSLADEIVVFFCPTDLQRYDIINDTGWNTNFDNHCTGSINYHSLWPADITCSDKSGLGSLSNSVYGKTIHSYKFEIILAIHSFKLLIDWVKLHKAKLFVFPAFNRYYNKEYFTKNYNNIIERDMKTFEFISEKNSVTNKLIDCVNNFIPWDNFITIDGYKTFFDLAFGQEKNYDSKLEMIDLTGNNGGTENQYIMKCGHPGVKAHSLLADKIYAQLF